jgi:Na+/proline symporter/signal transduction histidine kinase
MSPISIFLTCTVYMALLFFVAWWVDRNSARTAKLIDSSWIYALTLAIYCTAWTFFGSVGRASSAGLGFMAVYLGPALLSPLWYLVLYKMILIAKNERIGSIADFISARYGRSATVGIITTSAIVLTLIPYISIQIQAVNEAIKALSNGAAGADDSASLVPVDTCLLITIVMAIFAAIFGTRKLDPNERHEGLMASIALESLVKLVAFLSVGLFVTFGLYQGFGDLFENAITHAETSKLFTFDKSGITGASWFTVLLLSAFAFLLLPRQFHVAVVENTNPRHVRQAMWLVPLYLLVINIFVFPIALAGKMLLAPTVSPDTYVLSLPLFAGMKVLALLVFIGGFSAAISMVVIETTALSIILSNHIFVPLLLRLGLFSGDNSGNLQLLQVRRFAIVLVLLAAYFYEIFVTKGSEIVSIGLISFAGVAQLVPATIIGMYWRKGNAKGAGAGIVIGTLIWAYCLAVPYMAKAGVISNAFISEGLFGLHFLKPYALFGMNQWDSVTHGTFWSLLCNLLAYLVVSEWTSTNMVGLNQADRFVNVQKYTHGPSLDPIQREASLPDLRMVLERFLGEQRTDAMIAAFKARTNWVETEKAPAELVNFAEIQLTGVIGAASARIAISGIAQSEPVTVTEVIQLLEQTREALEYSKVVESKNSELNQMTQQLRNANTKLMELDRLKADFIASVTHELRTPITSIMAFARIIQQDRGELSEEKQVEFLNIIVKESERITRMVNMVLDLEKIQSSSEVKHEFISLQDLLEHAIRATQSLTGEKQVVLGVGGIEKFAEGVMGNKDQLTQVLINLLSNAIKFCPNENGRIEVSLRREKLHLILSIQDNGAGITLQDEQFIFEKFAQASQQQSTKPHGTGLGLYISKKILDSHSGQISVQGRPGLGAVFYVQLPLVKAENESI